MAKIGVCFALSFCDAQVYYGDKVWFVDGRKNEVSEELAPQMRNLGMDRSYTEEDMKDEYPYPLVLEKLKMLYVRGKTMDAVVTAFPPPRGRG